MKYVLPLAPPFIESYLHHAYQMSIICNEKKTYPWIFSNYIQLYFDGNDTLPVQFYMPDHTNYTWNVLCPWLDYQVIKKETITKNRINILDFVSYAIESGFYIVMYVNEKHIPGKASFQLKDLTHLFMVYGYDSEKEVLNHLGYTNRRFGPTEVSFRDFQNAFDSNADYYYHTHDNLFLLRINHQFGYNINLYKILADLDALLHSRRQVKFNDDPLHVFGLDVYKNINRIIRQNIEDGSNIKIQPFLLLSEHKKIMHQRLMHLSKNNYYSGLEELATQYLNFRDVFLSIRNLALLFNHTKRAKAMKSAIDDIEALRKEEEEALNTIIQLMKQGFY